MLVGCVANSQKKAHRIFFPQRSATSASEDQQVSEERTQRRQTTPRTKWIAALALLLVSLPANAAPTKCAVTLRSGGKLINASVYGGRVCIHNATDIVIRGNRIRPQARMPAL